MYLVHIYGVFVYRALVKHSSGDLRCLIPTPSFTSNYTTSSVVCVCLCACVYTHTHIYSRTPRELALEDTRQDFYLNTVAQPPTVPRPTSSCPLYLPFLSAQENPQNARKAIMQPRPCCHVSTIPSPALMKAQFRLCIGVGSSKSIGIGHVGRGCGRQKTHVVCDSDMT